MSNIVAKPFDNGSPPSSAQIRDRNQQQLEGITVINDLLIAAEKRGVLVARAELTPFGMSDRVEGVVVQKGEQHFLLFTRDGLWLINEVRLTDAGAWEHDNMLCGDLGPTSATASDAIDIALTKRFVDSYPPSDARVPITGPDFGIPFSTAE